MKQLFVVTVAIAVCLLGFGNDVTGLLPEAEIVAIKAFFKEFKDALNSNDVEQVKRMSGSAWEHFSCRINCGDIVEAMDIIDVSISNVTAKTTVRDVNGDSRSAKVMFLMKKSDGLYSIDKMLLPESERRHNEFKESRNAIKRLEVAINNHDVEAIKRELSFGEVNDFKGELLGRGLLWIDSALNCGNGAKASGAHVLRENDGVIIGRINVRSHDGTMVLREVYFSGAKIDRAAPSELERLEERRKQMATQQSDDDRKRSETEMTEIIRKRFFKRIKQNRKNKEPSK